MGFGAALLRRGKPASKPVANRAVQDWLPVRDLDGGLLVRRDGARVAVIRVDPAPFALLSERERDRRIGALHEAIQGLPGAAQILVVSRPIALDGYLAAMEVALGEAEGQRRGLLRGYLGYVREVVGGGEAPERQYYVLVPSDPSAAKKTVVAELRARAGEFVVALARAELQARVCDDGEVLALLMAWLHPAHAARERIEEAPLPTARYVAEGGDKGDRGDKEEGAGHAAG